MRRRVTILILLLAGAMPFLMHPPARGEDRDEEKKLQELQIGVKKGKEAIRRKEKEEASIIHKLHAIDQELDRRTKELARYESDLIQNQRQQEKVQAEVRALEGEIEKSLERLKGRLCALYKSGGIGLIRIIFSTRSIAQLLQSLTFMRYIADADARILEQMRERGRVYQKRCKELEEYESRIMVCREQAYKEKDALEKEQAARRSLLASVKEDKSRQLSLLRDLDQRSEKLRTIIESRRARSSYQGDFAAMKDSLIWPVQGTISTLFGLHYDEQLNRNILHNGISISAPPGSEIVSVGAGSVLFAGWFLGYGKMVIIDHGKDYITIYAHASELFIREGQTVKAGERIATVGDTDSMQGPGLYFEVRFKGRPSDPIEWLSRKGNSLKVGKKKGLPNNR